MGWLLGEVHMVVLGFQEPRPKRNVHTACFTLFHKLTSKLILFKILAFPEQVQTIIFA